jgi:hypothetical protein
MAQVVSSLEKKVTPQQVHIYSGAAPSISRSGGWMQGKSRTLSLTPEKEHLQDLAAKEDQVGLFIPKLGGKSKHVLQNYIIRLQHV